MQILKLQHRQAAGLLVGFFIVFGVLCVLAGIAIPHVGEMVYQSQAREKETELLRIQSAVDEMLHLSFSGKLTSIGPVADLSRVQTADPEPMVLTDYLPTQVRGHLIPGCTYSFTADGIVLQMTN